MRVILCSCNGLMNLPDFDFGVDIKLERYDNLCQQQPQINPDEKVVIAGCSPTIMERFFPNIDAEFVNLREHVFLVSHPVSKTKDLISAAIEKVRTSVPVKIKIFPINKKQAVVIGGGVAGIETAREIAKEGIPVIIIEKTPFLGGTVAKLDRLYPEGTPYSHTVLPLINALLKNNNINFHFNAEVSKVSGAPGDYKFEIITRPRGVIKCNQCGKCLDVCPIEVNDQGKIRKAIYYIPTYPNLYAIDFETCTRCDACVKVCPGKIDLNEKSVVKEAVACAAVVATGLNFYDVTRVGEYGYKRFRGIMTHLEFERAISSGSLKPRRVVFVCCAGSRDSHHLVYCSKICCFLALKEAKLVKDRYPETQVNVVAMDMRSYGNFEYFYNRLREQGISFIKGKPSEIFEREGNLIVRTEDLYTNELYEIEADAVVLSNGFIPDQNTLEKFSIKLDGNFPVYFENSNLGNPELPRAVFTAGSSTFPSGVAETLIDARKAAYSVLSLINREKIETKHPISLVNDEKCSICRMCISACPYNAILIVDEKIKIREDLCMGCGICASTCPAYASQLEWFTPASLTSHIRHLIKPGDILALLCKWSAYNATDMAAYEKLDYPENVKIIKVPCSGAVEPSHIIYALNRKVRGVLIGGCYPDACHYAKGNYRARAREGILKETLNLLGFDKKVVRLEWIGKDEAKKYVEIVKEMNR